MSPVRLVVPVTVTTGHCADGSRMHPAPRRIGELAWRALHAELYCYPKPGLVGPHDNGSHDDMNADLFIASALALRDYFAAIAAAGARAAPFMELQALGMTAERRMLRATGGVNTHRGAIFSLGLLAAAAGRLQTRGRRVTGGALGAVVRRHWGAAILASGGDTASHGSLVARRYGHGGARAEAAAGFPHVFDVGLPALRQALALTGDTQRARVQCFFHLLAVVPDTNVLYRAGPDGLQFAQHAARAFLAAGGSEHRDWCARAQTIHRAFVARRLSPGGCADLFAATLFVHGLQTHGNG